MDLPTQPILDVIEAWYNGVRIPATEDRARLEFFPKPVNIRTGVEHLTGTDYRTVLEANRDWILTYLRRHGTTKKKWGERYEEYVTPEGRLDMRRTSEAIPTPELSPLMERTMANLGGGEMRHGMTLMSRHPLASSHTPEDDPETAKSIKWLDGRFDAAFARALREDR